MGQTELTIVLRLWGLWLDWHIIDAVKWRDHFFTSLVVPLVYTYWLFLEGLHEASCKIALEHHFLNYFSVYSGLCYFCFVSSVTIHTSVFCLPETVLITSVHCCLHSYLLLWVYSGSDTSIFISMVFCKSQPYECSEPPSWTQR